MTSFFCSRKVLRSALDSGSACLENYLTKRHLRGHASALNARGESIAKSETLLEVKQKRMRKEGA
jgi:hypothetical protein